MQKESAASLSPCRSPTSEAGPRLRWVEGGAERSAAWRSEAGQPPPQRVRVVDDTLTADAACRLACEGTALLWRGDFQNARQLLQAMARRIERPPRRKPGAGKSGSPATPTELFHRQRMAQAQRVRVLGMVLIPFEGGHVMPLRRAPDVRDACREAYGAATEAYVVSLRELLGLVGAHEWRKKGVAIAAVGGRIHPHYGVFSPVRGEYVRLVAETPLPDALHADDLAFDIGTGTGVLAAVLAKRGVARVVATDQDERALVCARENVERLGVGDRVDIRRADLYPPGRASLVVCNPPWLPGKPASSLEYAIYDPGSRMLRGFLDGLAEHLEPDGEGWLILSDLAEHLGLRSRGELLGWFEAAGLTVLGRQDTRPTHARVQLGDPRHETGAVLLKCSPDKIPFAARLFL